jgi:hypothetical protein
MLTTLMLEEIQIQIQIEFANFCSIRICFSPSFTSGIIFNELKLQVNDYLKFKIQNKNSK